MFDNIFLNLSTTYLANSVYLLYHLKYILHDKVSSIDHHPGNDERDKGHVRLPVLRGQGHHG